MGKMVADAKESGRKPMLFSSVELYPAPGIMFRDEMVKIIDAYGGVLLSHHLPNRRVEGPGSDLQGRARLPPFVAGNSRRKAFHLVDPSPDAIEKYQDWADVISTAFVWDSVRLRRTLCPDGYVFSWKFRQRLQAKMLNDRSARSSSSTKSAKKQRKSIGTGGRIRIPYTAEEDDAIISFVRENEGVIGTIGGNKLWHAAHDQGITTRSWQSMKDRFRKQLMERFETDSNVAQRADRVQLSAGDNVGVDGNDDHAGTFFDDSLPSSISLPSHSSSSSSVPAAVVAAPDSAGAVVSGKLKGAIEVGEANANVIKNDVYKSDKEGSPHAEAGNPEYSRKRSRESDLRELLHEERKRRFSLEEELRHVKAELADAMRRLGEDRQLPVPVVDDGEKTDEEVNGEGAEYASQEDSTYGFLV